MVSFGETGGLFVRLLFWRVIRDFTCAEAFGDGILPVTVPTVNDIIHQGPRKVFVAAWTMFGTLRRKGWLCGFHILSSKIFASDFCA